MPTKQGIILIITIWVISMFAISLIAVQVHAQFVPPPPVVSRLEDGFNERDRAWLMETRDNTRAIYQKMFVKIQDGSDIHPRYQP